MTNTPLRDAIAEIDALLENWKAAGNNYVLRKPLWDQLTGHFIVFWPALRSALLDVREWRPIEEMPTDGKPFLAEFYFSDRNEYEVIQVKHWDRDPDGSVVFMPFIGRGKARPCIRVYPKRWMPLPQPPQPQDAGGG